MNIRLNNIEIGVISISSLVSLFLTYNRHTFQEFILEFVFLSIVFSFFLLYIVGLVLRGIQEIKQKDLIGGGIRLATVLVLCFLIFGFFVIMRSTDWSHPPQLQQIRMNPITGQCAMTDEFAVPWFYQNSCSKQTRIDMIRQRYGGCGRFNS